MNDSVFTDPTAGPATPRGNAVTFDDIVEAIRSMKPATLPEHKLGDVLTMIEYLGGELVARHDAQVAEAARLAAARADLEQREAALSLRLRAVSMMEATPPAAPHRGIFGVLSRARG